MNLFYTHEDPWKAARDLADSHAVKMPLEQAQMMSSTHRLLETPQAPFVYKMTHKNHPSTKWIRSSQIAYKWGLEHLEALLAEYRYRYGRIHKTQREKLQYLKAVPAALPDLPFIAPPQCIYDECKTEDTVQAYRNYYKARRSEIDMRWTKRSAPVWL